MKFKEWDCIVSYGQYSNGQMAIQLDDAEDGSPVAVATVSVPGIELKPDEVIIKDYSENEGMLSALVNAEIVIPTDRVVESTYVKMPICKIIKCDWYTVDVTWKYTASKEFKTQRYFFANGDAFTSWLKSQRDESLRKIIKFQTYGKGITENNTKSSKDFK